MSKLPETGPSLLRHLRQQQRRMIRNENASPFTRSGTSVTAEGRVEVTGQMQSGDYDGTSRTDLGTAGWMLGPDDGGASLLALNGIDVYADLAAKDVTILGLIDDLAAKDVVLTDLVSKVVKVGSFDHSETGFDPPDTWGTVSSVTLTVPNGFTQAVVTAVAYVKLMNNFTGIA